MNDDLIEVNELSELARLGRRYIQRWSVVMYCYDCRVYECVGFDGDILDERPSLLRCSTCGHRPRTVKAAEAVSVPRFAVVEGGKK